MCYKLKNRPLNKLQIFITNFVKKSCLFKKNTQEILSLILLICSLFKNTKHRSVQLIIVFKFFERHCFDNFICFILFDLNKMQGVSTKRCVEIHIIYES